VDCASGGEKGHMEGRKKQRNAGLTGRVGTPAAELPQTPDASDLGSQYGAIPIIRAAARGNRKKGAWQGSARERPVRTDGFGSIDEESHQARKSPSGITSIQTKGHPKRNTR